MASDVRVFSVTIPAGTAIATPLVTNLTMPWRIVTEVRVTVPRGCSGMVGWALGAAGVPVLPWNAGAWLVADDRVVDWPLSKQIDSGAWQITAYNLGVWPHTLQVEFLLELPYSITKSQQPSPIIVTP